MLMEQHQIEIKMAGHLARSSDDENRIPKDIEA
jgi:hypothetical protein